MIFSQKTPGVIWLSRLSAPLLIAMAFLGMSPQIASCQSNNSTTFTLGDIQHGWQSVPTSNSTFIYDANNTFTPQQIKQLAAVDVYVVKPANVVVNTKGKTPFSVRHPVAYRRWMTFNNCFAGVTFGVLGAGLQATTAVRVK